jgi:hypothetical protein
MTSRRAGPRCEEEAEPDQPSRAAVSGGGATGGGGLEDAVGENALTAAPQAARATTGAAAGAQRYTWSSGAGTQGLRGAFASWPCRSSPRATGAKE